MHVKKESCTLSFVLFSSFFASKSARIESKEKVPNSNPSQLIIMIPGHVKNKTKQNILHHHILPYLLNKQVWFNSTSTFQFRPEEVNINLFNKGMREHYKGGFHDVIPVRVL